MKKCCRCQQTKPLEDFNRFARSKDGRQPACRSCSSAYYRGNATRHKQNVHARNTRMRQEMGRRVREYLLDHPCIDCGEADPVVLDFDHVTGEKRLNISRMVTWGWPWETILAEIAKCVVRCANCHRRKTARQLGWYAFLVDPGAVSPDSSADRAAAF